MELIQSIKFEPEEIEDILTAIDYTLNNPQQHELTEERIDRMEGLRQSLSIVLKKSNTDVSLKKKH